MKSFAWFVFLLAIALLTILPSLKEQAEQAQILQRAEIAEHLEEFAPTQDHEQRGTVYATAANWSFSTAELQSIVHKMPQSRRHFYYTWSREEGEEVTGSASGVDQKTWFANSFLVGYKPFDTESIWEPLATLSLRKGYILDHQLYGPQLAEVWQNSRQGFLYSRGDCEDHAIILADWLIALGHNARVVLGKHKNQGHAWVILFKNGKEYVLEATSKRRPRSIRDFELAALATDYHPIYQFDREHFWVNTGSEFTTRYNDAKWHIRSTFKSPG